MASNSSGTASVAAGGSAADMAANLPHDDLGPSLRTAVWLMTGLSLAFLSTRLYCKLLRHRKIHFDDMVLIASWVSSSPWPCPYATFDLPVHALTSQQLSLAGVCTCVTIDVSYGLGKHAYDNTDLTEKDLDTVSIVGLLSITFIISSLCWSKSSWAITLLHVSSGRTRAFVWFAILSMNSLFAPAAILYWLQCNPIEKAWRPLVPGTCLSPQVSIVLDIVASCKFGLGTQETEKGLETDAVD